MLNYIVTFIVFVLLFLIVRFLYYAWDFIANPSIVAMLSIPKTEGIAGWSYKKYTGKIIHGDTKPFIFGFQDAIKELKKNAGTQFDPEFVEVFINKVTPERV